MSALVVDHLWQSTLFVAFAWLLTLLLRGNAARIRFWVWFSASVKFLIPFSLLTMLGEQFSWQGSHSSSSTNALLAIVQQVSEPLATPAIVLRTPQPASFDLLRILFAVWILGCVLLLLRWSVNWIRIKAAVRNAAPVAIQSPIVVKSTSIMSEPGVVGIVRPVLLLPEGIAARLSAQQMQAILAHELCHVRRHDNLTASMHMLVEAIFWFHPLVWWIGARLVDERERACDEGVVDLGNEPQPYAEAILKVCQFYMESKLTCVAGVSGANLKHRVEVIMKNRSVANLSVAKKILLTSTATMALVAPITAGLLSSQLAIAQSQTAIDAKRAFDEASIARTPPATDSNPTVWSLMKDGNYSARGQKLRGIIAFAYGVEKSRVLGGPEWLDSVGYNIEAQAKGHVDGEMPAHLDSYRQMLRTLLEDRFRIIVHKELQPVSAYVMTVSEKGTTLTTPPEGIPSWIRTEPRATADKSGFSFQASSMQMLSWTFSSILARPVIDQTKIEGKYSFRLDLPVVPGKSRAELLPSAVEKQLGIKLVAQMVPLDVVIIDGAQQPAVDDVFDAPTRSAQNK